LHIDNKWKRIVFTDLSFNIEESAINVVVVIENDAIAKGIIENVLLIIIDVLAVVTNGNDELAHAGRYDWCN
jgi:hypothetical protein